MKNLTTRILGAFAIVAMGSVAFAQTADEMQELQGDTAVENAPMTETEVTEVQEIREVPPTTNQAPAQAQAPADEKATAQGEMLAPSPAMTDPNRKGFFQVGIGPAFSVGLDSDDMLYNILLSYNRRFATEWTGKVFGDLYLGAGSDNARMANLGVGADYLITQATSFGNALPYVGGGLGFTSARNSAGSSESALGVSADTGIKFVTEELNWDVNATYTLLTNEMDGTLPSVFGLRAAVNF